MDTGLINWGSLHGYEFFIFLLFVALCVVLLLLFRKRRSAFEEYLSIASKASQNAVVFGVEVTPKTVSKKARIFWPRGEADGVLAELGDGPESTRVKIAAIWLSNGSLDDLKRWVRIGRIEERGVLISAECPPEVWMDKTSGKDLDLEIGERRAEHVRRYRDWLTGKD